MHVTEIVDYLLYDWIVAPYLHEWSSAYEWIQVIDNAEESVRLYSNVKKVVTPVQLQRFMFFWL